jgi:hypothetical protein
MSLNASGEFTTDNCGGYGSSVNPQFSLKVNQTGDYKITVSAEQKTTGGLIFWINQNNNLGGSRLLSLNAAENPEVAKSAYLITNSSK